MASRPLGSFLAILMLAALVPGCESKEPFEACEMSEKMKNDCDFDSLVQHCEELETTCYASCMVADHPQCLDGPCMIYQFRLLGSADTYKSTPFCSEECTTDEDCPGGSKCLPFLAQTFCVPDEHIIEK